MVMNARTEFADDGFGWRPVLFVGKALASLKKKIISAPFKFVRGWLAFGKKDPDLVVHRRNNNKAATYASSATTYTEQ